MNCLPSTTWSTYVPIAIGYAMLALAIWRITNVRSPCATFWMGTALVIFGVFGPLYVTLFVRFADATVRDFERDSFLIVAAIGANLIASAVLALGTHDPVLKCPGVWVRRPTGAGTDRATTSPAPAPEEAAEPGPGAPVAGKQPDDDVHDEDNGKGNKEGNEQVNDGLHGSTPR